MEHPRQIRVIFFREYFNRRFSIYDRYRLGKIANELPSSIELIYSTDIKLLETADVVIFDAPFAVYEIVKGIIPKYEDQIWVGWCLECEENYPLLKDLAIRELFELWMSYHTDADIVLPYYDASFSTELLLPPTPKKGDVCMFVSSGINHSKRQEYLSELMKYLPIDSYGNWRRNKRLPEDNGYRSKMELLKSYRFTIAFENAIGKDYVTEKFYEPLLSGSVPVYLGAPNINDFSPDPSAFINVHDYPEPKDLADTIQRYCEDEQKYAAFFDWKKRPMNPMFFQLLKRQEVHPFIRLINYLFPDFNIKLIGNVYGKK